MAIKEFVNSFDESPYIVEAFDSGATLLTKCSVESLKCLLNAEEASANRLVLPAYKEAVDTFCNPGRKDDMLMIVAFEKDSSVPVAMALLTKKAYDVSNLTPLPEHPVKAEMRNTNRKLCWELSYCVRKADQRSKCLGDICLSCAIDEVCSRAENHPSTFIWLVVAGGFNNTPALRLYLGYGFVFIGMNASAVMMALCNVGEESVRKALKQVTEKLEAKFLLPVLRQTANSQQTTLNNSQLSSQLSGQMASTSSEQLNSQEMSTHGTQDPASQGSINVGGSVDGNPLSQHSNVASSQESDDSEVDESSGPRGKRRRVEEGDDTCLSKALSLIIGSRTEEDLERYLSSLEFTTFDENLGQMHLPAVLQCQKDQTEQDMVNHMQSMAANIVDNVKTHALLQNLQFFKQLEYLSAIRGENIMNTVSYLVDNRKTSMSQTALKEVVRVGWAVYRYPVLGQVKLNWAHAKIVLPAAAQLFDKKVEANESLPANVMRAQKSRYDAPCLRVSLEFPYQPLGDGDGLPSCQVTELHGLYAGDRAVNTADTTLYQKCYPSSFAPFQGTPNVRIEMRSRLIGYDTQEAPREPGRRDCNVPQPFWREGRQFLGQQLNDLKGEIPVEQARILCDCYGVDLYGRMLLDIRAVYDAEDTENEPVPTLRKLELAERALQTGFAFPTNHHLVTDNLWHVFQEAIRLRRGGFGSDSEFVHPSKCRKARYQLEISASRARRNRYQE